ncbi:hypothetical protein PRZ48_000373 [Zasmidium cellare]|uniref:BTB domain-containing protein n=1 Tax=Zasmidium cellare TaxID=395010 RepID=A0ABR0EYA2_ZASCE|nr:hypothetical protein PRZ48_000373 [Zasmidium cellare]
MAASFPQAGDENVEVYLTSDTSEKILLHSYVLALHSKWFKASLSERWNGGDAPHNDKNRWTYELRFDKDSAFGMLSRRAAADVTSTTKTDTETISSKPPTTAKELHKERMARVNAHKQMLGALYHIIPTFSHESFDSARTSIVLLAEAADVYNCEQVIKIHTENHLRLYRNEVLDLCASDPVGMLELAMAIKSEWVFMEASTHLIGRSKYFFGRVKEKLRGMGLVDLFEEKRTQLKEKLSACERDMFMIENTSAKGWHAIVAMAYFRQWLSEELKSGAGSNLSQGYASLYHAIKRRAGGVHKASETGAVQSFLDQLFSDASPEDVASKLDEAFRRASVIVEPILKDVTRRQDKTDDPYRALTFMGISDEEIPWAQKK